VTIVDDDQGGTVQFSAASYTVNEPAPLSNVSASITLTRSGTNLADGASVVLVTGVGTAVSGVNYAPIATTVVFDLGESSKTVPVTVFGGSGAPDGNLTVPLTLLNPSSGVTLGTTKTAVLNIIDSVSSLRFSVPEYTVNEGAVATITVLRGGPPSGQITVPFSLGNVSAIPAIDYVVKTGTLTFAPNVTTQTFTVTTLKRPGDN